MARSLLVVDDDPFVRRLVTATLRDVSRFALLEAADGLEALEVADREQPAVVLLDVDTPRLDGLTACRRLRDSPGTSGATIVILTATDGRRIEADAQRAGADLLITKPFSPLELLRLVDRLGDEDAP